MKSPSTLLAALTDVQGPGDPVPVDRGALLGGLTFIEGVACGWGRQQVVEWFWEHLVSPGRMMKPTLVREPPAGQVVLEDPARGSMRPSGPSPRPTGRTHPGLGDPSSSPPPSLSSDSPSSPPPSSDEHLPKLLAIARTNVIKAMRGFIALPPDDRFLKAAIFAERAQRRRIDKGSVWVARPTESDALSDIVLSLFAVDVLMYREFHETKLCICDVCGRISYQPAITSRVGCVDHRPRSQTNSGFVLSSSNPGMPVKK